MPKSDESVSKVRKVLRAFNAGYAKHDLSALNDFMKLFVADDEPEVVGISGLSPGLGAWRLGREAVRALVKADWDYWGQITLDAENAHVRVLGNVAWLSTTATVTTFEDTEERFQGVQEATDSLHRVSTGEKRVKPLRMTATLVKQENEWRFQQMHFSFAIKSLSKAFAENA
jgi:hypothetical protein